jgi:uncharacterized membrane protein YqjE
MMMDGDNMIKVNYLPEKKAINKLLSYLFFFPVLRQLIYLLLMVLLTLFIFDKSGQFVQTLAFAGVLYYVYHLWRVLMNFRKAHRQYFSMITKNTFSMDRNQFEITYGYPMGESTHRRALSVVNKVIYSDKSLVILSGSSLFFVASGEYTEGSFEEMIELFKSYPEIRLKKI